MCKTRGWPRFLCLRFLPILRFKANWVLIRHSSETTHKCVKASTHGPPKDVLKLALLKYNLHQMHFTILSVLFNTLWQIYIQLCNHCHSQDRTPPTTPKVLCLYSEPRPLVITDLSHLNAVLYFLKCHINRSITACSLAFPV